MTHDVRLLEPDELRPAHSLFRGTLHSGPRPRAVDVGRHQLVAVADTGGGAARRRLFGTVASWCGTYF